MAFPTIESTATSSTNTAGANHIVTLPSGIVAGDLILVCMVIGSTSATLNAHADYTELLDEASAVGLKILYRWAAGGEGNPTFVSSANTRDATCTFRISGAKNPAAQAPEKAATTASGSSTTPDPPASAAPSATKDFLFVAFCGSAGEQADDGTYATGFPANYTLANLEKTCGVAGTNLGGMIAAAARQLNTGSADDPGTFTVSENNTWRAQTIMVHPPTNTTVTPGVLALTITTFAPTVTATNNQLVTPGTLALVTTAFAPTVSTPRLVTPGTLALVITTFAPTVTVNTTVTPGTLALTISTFAPTVLTPRLVTPGTLALAVSTFAPTVSTPRLVTPATASLTISTFAPTVSTPRLATPATASLTISTFAPTVQTPRTVTPGTLALTVSAFAPTVSTPRLVTPGAIALTITTFAPTVTAGSGAPSSGVSAAPSGGVLVTYRWPSSTSRPPTAPAPPVAVAPPLPVESIAQEVEDEADIMGLIPALMAMVR